MCGPIHRFAANGPGTERRFCPRRIRHGCSRQQPNPIYDLSRRSRRVTLRPPVNEADTWSILRDVKSATYRRSAKAISRLEAASIHYEMAARLQLSAPACWIISGAFGSHQAGSCTLDRKITDDFARNCWWRAAAWRRRSGSPGLGGGITASPAVIGPDHEKSGPGPRGDEMAGGMDKPAASLLKDLKSRGLLEDTIVFLDPGFGRLPCSPGAKGRGT